MYYLIEFSERKQVRSVIETAMEYESVQGVVLEIDPYWLLAWRLRETYGESSADRLLGYSLGSPFLGYPDFIMGSLWKHLKQPWIPSKTIRSSDLEWRPPLWEEYLSNFFGCPSVEPIIIKICLYPRASEQEASELSFDIPESRIVYETRPPAFLYSNPRKLHRPIFGGVSIGAGVDDYGTLGGILEDPSGRRYGLTCAHVIHGSKFVDQPAKYDGGNAARIGRVKHFSALSPCAVNAPCNPWDDKGAANKVDVALIQLRQNVESKLEVLEVGKLTGLTPKAQLTQGQSVVYTGRSSNHKSLELGGLGVAYRISDSKGKCYCFKHLIELKDPGYWSNIISPPVKPGDSGAWVCTFSQKGFEWCAMVIGGDRFTGFAVPSETIREWWSEAPVSISLDVG